MGADGGTETAGGFLDRAEAELLELSIEAQRADWVYATYITPDSELLSARAYSRLIDRTVALAKASTRLDPGRTTPEELRRL